MFTYPSTVRRALHASVPLLALLVLPAGCAKPPPREMVSSAGVPASQGTVEATAGANGNTNLEVRVKHLAPPEKVAADATVYVVWVQPRGAAHQSVGALRLNSELEGTLATVTPHRRFLVTVTPEPSGQVAEPTHDPVFTSDVDRDE
jgi:hypothetical protein